MPALAVCSADAIGQQSTCLKCAVNTARIRPLRTVSPSFLLRGYAMTCRYAAIGVAVASLLASSAFAGGPYGSISAGNWKGGAYTNDKTGAFSHCGASSGYANGVILLVTQNVGGFWSLGFGSQAFQLSLGETFPIDITFDGQGQFRFFGTALSSELVFSVLPGSAALEQFRKARLMVAVAKGDTFHFNLDSTGKVLPMIANCLTKVKAGGLAAAGDFSIPVPKPVVKPVVQTAPVAASPAPAPAPKTAEINGTGFLVSTNGHVVTNDHVISRCIGDVRGNLTGQATTTLRIVSKDETNDLALLQTPAHSKDVASIRATAIRSGDGVIAIGYPYHGLLTSDFTVTTGIVSSLSGILNDTRYLQISAAVQPGNSGGPLLDTSGNVVEVSI